MPKFGEITGYADIVFIEVMSEYAEFEAEVDNADDWTSAAVEYLSQWDHGEYGYVKPELGNGTDDDVIMAGEYVIVHNSRMGYVGLSRIFRHGRKV